VLVNEVEGQQKSWAFAFEINEPTVPSNQDSDFRTTFDGAACTFKLSIHGGARLIGESEEGRVWLVADNKGLWCVDKNGGSSSFSTPTQKKPYYDTFMYFTVQGNNDIRDDKPISRYLNETV
jgi:hypothetical protein